LDTATKELAPIEMIGVQTRLNDEEEQALLRVLREANTLTTGKEGEAFEKEFTEFIGCADAVALSSCSSALELAAVFSELGAGDEVIIPAHTFVSSAVPFGKTGAMIKWADIDRDTRLVSAETIRPLLSERTKAIVVVHLYGLAADMEPIMAIAREHDLCVIEDCAQAPGARCGGRRVGSFGHFGCFSFHSHKNMTTLGEGGMLTVRDAAHGRAARRMRWMGNWSIEQDREKYWQPAMGNIVEPIPGCWPANYCLGEPNAAVGRLLLRRLDAINDQRKQQAERFKEAFSTFPEVSFQTIPAGCEHVFHLMPIRYDGGPYGKTRDDLIDLLYRQYKIKCVSHYWPLNRTELFHKFGFGEANVPETDRYYENQLGFPWWSDMPPELLDDMAGRAVAALEQLRVG